MGSKSYILITCISVSLVINIHLSRAFNSYAKTVGSAHDDPLAQSIIVFKKSCREAWSKEADRAHHVNQVTAANFGDQPERGLSESKHEFDPKSFKSNTKITKPSPEDSEIQVSKKEIWIQYVRRRNSEGTPKTNRMLENPYTNTRSRKSLVDINEKRSGENDPLPQQLAQSFEHEEDTTKMNQEQRAAIKRLASTLQGNDGPRKKKKRITDVKNKTSSQDDKGNDQLSSVLTEKQAHEIQEPTKTQASTPSLDMKISGLASTTAKRKPKSEADKKSMRQNYDALELLGIAIMKKMQIKPKDPRFVFELQDGKPRKNVKCHSIKAIVGYIYAIDVHRQLHPSRNDLSIALSNAVSDLEKYWDRFDPGYVKKKADSSNLFFVSRKEDRAVRKRLQNPKFGVAEANYISSAFFLKWLRAKFPDIFKKMHRPRLPFHWITWQLSGIHRVIMCKLDEPLLSP